MSRYRWILLVSAVVVIAAATAGIFWVNKPIQAASEPKPLATGKVERKDLTDRQELNGEIDFGDAKTLKGKKSGTLTWLPEKGAAVKQGEALYRVDDHPVPLFIGDTPLYRAIDKAGLIGPDVKVLKSNLQALGFLGDDGRPDITTAATLRAITTWQKTNNLDLTGKIADGDYLVLPGPVKVSGHKANLGDAAAADLVETTALVPRVKLTLSDSTPAPKVGVAVSILDDSGTPKPGKITGIAAQGTTESGAAAAPAPGQPAGKQLIADFDSTDGLDYATGAQIRVQITTVDVKNVLAVPVVSLNALLEGGYAVRVPDSAGNKDSKPGYRLVPVKVGKIVKGLAEVSGDLTAGQDVVTAS
ncbi:peptidoglycan-binding protein [Arthrobacter methylotrophus]|uniref:Efflux RND transporter periplasmic adaptor subunit n=1 Tax=Arthrobacter methylotrophus TaxID=121291 RepID=A0ABV5UVG0_9MICC